MACNGNIKYWWSLKVRCSAAAGSFLHCAYVDKNFSNQISWLFPILAHKKNVWFFSWWLVFMLARWTIYGVLTTYALHGAVGLFVCLRFGNDLVVFLKDLHKFMVCKNTNISEWHPPHALDSPWAPNAARQGPLHYARGASARFCLGIALIRWCFFRSVECTFSIG